MIGQGNSEGTAFARAARKTYVTAVGVRDGTRIAQTKTAAIVATTVVATEKAIKDARLIGFGDTLSGIGNRDVNGFRAARERDTDLTG